MPLLRAGFCKRMKRIAFYGGSFDPVHNGHVAIAERLLDLFELDEFVFIPAFHAPHKKRKKPTSPFHRFAMLCLATEDNARIKVSKIELDVPERPYTVETLATLKERLPDTEIFFVMGADSWADITTWREWEKVLTLTDQIVVTRPGYEIHFDHVTDDVRNRIVDLRDKSEPPASAGGGAATVIGDFYCDSTDLAIEKRTETTKSHEKTQNKEAAEKSRIYITDAVAMNVSASDIRSRIRDKIEGWQQDVPDRVAKYIEKYELY